jgi:glutamate formiminotransferase
MRERELERLPTRKRDSLMLLLIFFYLSSAGQTERERERQNLREIRREFERVLGESLRCVIKGKDWAPFIVK